MTPIPVASSYAALNAMLSESCIARRSDRAGRHHETIGERLVADAAALDDLPAAPLEPCEKRAARVSSTALARSRGNDYSAPTTYGFQEVLVKGFQHLRPLLEARMGNRGKRAFIQGLRLMEAAPKEIVAGAVNDAIRLSRISEKWPPVFG